MSTAQDGPHVAIGLAGPRREGRVQSALRRPTLLIGIGLTATMVMLAVLAPWVSRYPPLQQHLTDGLRGPSLAHCLGTDQLGRDVWSRIVYAGRTDLRVGFLAVVFPFVFGTTIGIATGFYGKWFDAVVMRIVDVVLAFPFYVLVLALVFVLGAGTEGIYVAVGVTDWVYYARIARGGTLVARRLDWVAAAKGGGLSDRRVLLRHVLPNVVTQCIVYVMSDIVFVIVAVVTLSYLGIGVPPPAPDWGSMISAGQPFLTTDPALATLPGIAVVLTGLGLSCLGDGLGDILRPE